MHGDCLEVLPTLAEGSADAVVTDPPYGLEFMGKGWDGAVPGWEFWAAIRRVLRPGGYLLAFGGTRTYHRLAVAIEDGGFQIQDCISWLYGQGFPKGKTQLKPAWEPILLAYKPGPRALNVDECRIEMDIADREVVDSRSGAGFGTNQCAHAGRSEGEKFKSHALGRWPANVVLDEEAAAMLDEQTGVMTSGTAVGGLHRNGNKAGHVYGQFGKHEALGDVCYGDSGGASRFFYTAKADSGERHYAGRNPHPTVKPVDLMRWLCRLVTPPGGLVLDPFTGSGSTGIAAMSEGLRFLGIEREAEYVELARRRIAGPLFAEPA